MIKLLDDVKFFKEMQEKYDVVSTTKRRRSKRMNLLKMNRSVVMSEDDCKSPINLKPNVPKFKIKVSHKIDTTTETEKKMRMEGFKQAWENLNTSDVYQKLQSIKATSPQATDTSKSFKIRSSMCINLSGTNCEQETERGNSESMTAKRANRKLLLSVESGKFSELVDILDDNKRDTFN
mmetsp:Transcript_41689/g.48124  ORF Transcript_41689/g.48124 Transcript_41689/m.48124 type:complete len:179 (-) Transcript_41689:646-1182(-)